MHSGSSLVWDRADSRFTLVGCVFSGERRRVCHDCCQQNGKSVQTRKAPSPGGLKARQRKHWLNSASTPLSKAQPHGLTHQLPVRMCVDGVYRHALEGGESRVRLGGWVGAVPEPLLEALFI